MHRDELLIESLKESIFIGVVCKYRFGALTLSTGVIMYGRVDARRSTGQIV